MPYEKHPLFTEPAEDASLWRYIDFTKFVSLLETRQLYFTSIVKFDDKYEGAVSPIVISALREAMADFNLPPARIEQMMRRKKDVEQWPRSLLFVNCWHHNEYESAAMWRLYLKSNEGIALRTTFKRLADSLAPCSEQVYIGSVKYIDYDRESFPANNVFIPALHKRRSFEHEREVRAIYWGVAKFDESEPPPHGVNLPVDLGTLIERVYVAPTTPPWFYDLVRAVLKRYGLDKEVQDSSIDKAPLY